jgi:ribonuclease BN (tRNA processing enzyme)
VLVLDAGTGARALGHALIEESPPRIHLFITHLHVDHVEGLGVFEPIWRPGTELHLWGPPSPVASVDARLAKYFSPPLFPVHLSEVPANVTFHDATEGTWTVGGATLRSAAIQHAGITVGYRVEADGVSLTYLTDHEPALGMDLETAAPEWISGAALAWETDLLIHDCQYTEEEYPDRAGFGHSSTKHVADFARLSGAHRLLLFHHDPNHDDDELESLCDRVRELWAGGKVDLAREGEEIDFG